MGLKETFQAALNAAEAADKATTNAKLQAKFADAFAKFNTALDKAPTKDLAALNEHLSTLTQASDAYTNAATFIGFASDELAKKDFKVTPKKSKSPFGQAADDLEQMRSQLQDMDTSSRAMQTQISHALLKKTEEIEQKVEALRKHPSPLTEQAAYTAELERRKKQLASLRSPQRVNADFEDRQQAKAFAELEKKTEALQTGKLSFGRNTSKK